MGVEGEGYAGLPGVTLFNISAANWNKRVGLRWTRRHHHATITLLNTRRHLSRGWKGKSRFVFYERALLLDAVIRRASVSFKFSKNLSLADLFYSSIHSSKD